MNAPDQICTVDDAFQLVRFCGLLDDAAVVVIVPERGCILAITDLYDLPPCDDVGHAIEGAIRGLDAFDGAGSSWIVWSTPPGDLLGRSVHL